MKIPFVHGSSRPFSRRLFLAGILSLAALTNLSADNVRVIVGFHGDVDAGVFNRLGGKAATRLNALGAVAGNIPTGKLNALRGQPGVAYVEEDLVREANLEPNDTYYRYNDFGLSYEADGYNDQIDDFALINAQEAWNKASGAGVTVAVLDSGYDMTHPDAGNVSASRNFTRGKASDVSDKDGHGTHTAGTVAAATNNGIGVAGTARDADLAIGKVLGSQGGYDSWIAAGMTWSVDTADANIVSMSLGGTGTSTTLDQACEYVWSKGRITIAAAGNDGVDASNHYPSAHLDVMSVAAVDEHGAWASFSNWGATVEIAAPGVAVLSTFNDGGYGWASGTSMACPHVSGVAALVISVNPRITNEDLRSRLTETEPTTQMVTAHSFTIPIVDASKAVESSATPPTVEITNPSDGTTVSGEVILSATADPEGANIVFYLGTAESGTVIGPDSWDSNTVANGAYTITAVAVGVAGWTGSNSVTVTVANESNPPSTMTVDSISPNSITAGDSKKVVIAGLGFDPTEDGTSVIALNGSGKAPVFSLIEVTDKTITADVAVSNGGPPRNRVWDISVSSGGETAVLPEAFTVQP